MSAEQVCVRCVMNNAVDTAIQFNLDGVCHHCLRYEALLESRTANPESASVTIDGLVQKMRRHGAGRDYDCIIGVSGGVDSTYVAYYVKQLGLKPLAVHFDNGWNSELAVKNIEQVLTKLDIDLYTYVVNWREFRALQIAFLRASTPDGEIPTDHAIFALLWREAHRRNIRYIISGMNFRSESISVPNWAYGHSDWMYIKDVNKRFGNAKLKTYPHFSLPYLFYITFLRRVRTVSILNYIDYDKEQVKKFLLEELGWRDYGGKHHESIYTRYYQGVFLPKKFGIDKRYGHLSDLINSGQLRREEALLSLREPTYDPDQQKADREYVIKKLGLTEAEFVEIEQAPAQTYRSFRNSQRYIDGLKRLVNWARYRGLYPK